MRNVGLLRKSMVCLMCLMLVIMTFVTASAQSMSEVTLTDAQNGTGDTYELVFSAKCEGGISAFEIDLEYDAQNIAYYGATIFVDNLNHSINALESGRVQIVAVADGVISCNESIPVITLKLKSLTETDAKIGIAISDVIDGNGNVLSENVFTTSTAKVSAWTDKGSNDSVPQQTDSVVTEKVTLEEGEMSLVKGYTSVAGIPVKNQTLVSLILATICTLFMIGYIAYVLGARMQKKKLIPVPLEFEEDEVDK